MIVQKRLYIGYGGKDARNFGEGDFIVNIYYTFIYAKTFKSKIFDSTVSV